VRLRVAGPTLANLYPFILLPLPETPAYDVSGHLKLGGNTYTYESFKGLIGRSDVSGDATYIQRQPRPYLQAKLKSKRLDFADLGPLIGVKSDRSAKPAANVSAAPIKRGKVLPDEVFNVEKLNAIDASVSLEAARVDAPRELALENLNFDIRLQDGLLKLAPLSFGFSGGTIASIIELNAKPKTPTAKADVRFEHVRLDKLFPTIPIMAKSAGQLGARINLTGSGNTIAGLLAGANGTSSLAMNGGHISNLVDAAIGLNGGKILSLLIGGDKEIGIRCAASSFDFKDGVGTSSLLIIDTDQTRISGNGTVNLKDERFDIRLAPKPKRPGILSLRSPLELYGTFNDAKYRLSMASMMARGGGAAALALVNPFLLLVPLIETGPGTDTDCQNLLPKAKAVKAAERATARR
jgi:uncharacterized protein involved in outer membrane biogenesis